VARRTLSNKRFDRSAVSTFHMVFSDTISLQQRARSTETLDVPIVNGFLVNRNRMTMSLLQTEVAE
jgi:hypothetical protein